KQRCGRILSKSIYISPTNLIEFSDITASSYGLGFFYENLDYKLNPRKGISMSFNGTAGIRVINKNPNINEEYYGNFKLRSSQYQLESEFSFYIPVRKKSTVKSVLQCASLNGNQIFRNELFRIGGLKTLRGFNEESIFSSTYIIGTVEYRFLFEQNSNLFLFGDFCWYEKNETVGYLKDMPIGLGTGINFETKAGIFSLTYALGNQLNNGFDIRSGKIHFGVVNNF
ncbi:MAG: BamA/TamA family outer membrane protein, partial [Bacteroidota bacterium]